MDIYDRKKRHARAMNLFESEAREQQLSAIALNYTVVDVRSVAPVNTSDNPNAIDLATGIQVLGHASDANILDAHIRLRAARIEAARMAASDPELARLNALIDGTPHAPSESEPMIIEGERVDATFEP